MAQIKRASRAKRSLKPCIGPATIKAAGELIPAIGVERLITTLLRANSHLTPDMARVLEAFDWVTLLACLAWIVLEWLRCLIQMIRDLFDR